MAEKPRVVAWLLSGLLAALLLLPGWVAGDGSGDSEQRDGPALSEQDCPTLMALYRALRDDGLAADEPPVKSLGEAILDRPGCGEVRGQLREVRSGSGVNPWDARQPGGFGVAGADEQ